MTEIPVGFTIVTPGSLDPGMHLGLEVKWLVNRSWEFYPKPELAGKDTFT